MVSRVIPVDVFDLVIFGGTGDLARRKILPGLYRRFLAGQMPEDSRIIGAARADLTDEAFREQVRAALAEFVPKARQDQAAIEAFLGQKRSDKTDLHSGYCRLADILGLPHPDAEPATKVGIANAKVIEG